MNDRFRVLEFQAALLLTEIEMQAMIAENKQRESLGQSMAYTEESFYGLIDKYGIYINAIPVYTGT